MPVTDLGQAHLGGTQRFFELPTVLCEVPTVFPDQPREATPVGEGRLGAQQIPHF